MAHCGHSQSQERPPLKGGLSHRPGLQRDVQGDSTLGYLSTIEVGTEADVILAPSGYDALKVAQYWVTTTVIGLGPICIQESSGKVPPDHAPGVADHGQLPVSEVVRRPCHRMGVGMGGEKRSVGQGGDVDETCSFNYDRASIMPSSLHNRTRSLPAAVRPEPLSCVDETAKGTPWPKIVGRPQTEPSDRKPTSWKT